MKTTQEMSTVDRISTHEELHQVLALLNDPTDHLTVETAPEVDEEDPLQEAVSSLWPDATSEDGKDQSEGSVYRWAEFAGKSERVN
jgi:hypothetical protein